jgi:L-lactate transport
MWQQVYLPVADSLALSALTAAIPIVVMLVMIGVVRKPPWAAALGGLGASLVIAIAVYGMPAPLAMSSVTYGAAFGLFPICWIVFWAIVLYRLTLESGKFEIIKDSIGGLTSDKRMQAMLIAFALGAFIEGAAGFGTPVAVAATMLVGLGFNPFYAAGICLLANTAPVAFGSIGIPVVALAGLTGFPEMELSGWVGAICAPVSLFIPTYLMLVMGGWTALRGVLPAAFVCGVAFAATQFSVSRFIGPQLVDIASGLVAIVATVLLLLVWKPKDEFHLAGEHSATIELRQHGFGPTLHAWSPYLFLVILVLLWGTTWVKGNILETVTTLIEWPGLHNQVIRMAPVVADPTPYGAVFNGNWASAAGTACMLATFGAAASLGVSPGAYVRLLGSVFNQLFLAIVTVASVLGFAFLMNYSGMAATLGLAFASTGVVFPFFSALLGWLGVFMTGSDVSSNALFANLQVITANQLGLDPALMASSNSAGGVMGKMISLQSIAVAGAATLMSSAEQVKLFRFTLRHSIFLASVLGMVTMAYAYLL